MLFNKKQPEGMIDVWWLYDDGGIHQNFYLTPPLFKRSLLGLTLLLPYIISTRSNWSSCKLRIFCTPSAKEDFDKEKEGMTELLDSFRINYSDVLVLKDLDHQPKEATKSWFDALIRPFIRRDEISGKKKNHLNLL